MNQSSSKFEMKVCPSIVWKAMIAVLLLILAYNIKGVLLLFFLSIVLASALEPVVARLERKRIARVWGTIVIYVFLVLSIISLTSLLVPIFSLELGQLINHLPQYIQSVDGYIRDLYSFARSYQLESNAQQIVANTSTAISNSIGDIFSNSLVLLNGFIGLIVVLSLSFYMLVKRDGVNGFLEVLTPKKYHNYVIGIASDIQYKMGRWLIGQVALMVIIFALDYLALTLLDIPYALIIAIIGGLLEIVPYIGPIISTIVASLIGLTVSPLIGLVIFIVYFVIQQAENHILTPIIMKKAVGLNPVVVIMSLLIGAELAGILGVLLAIPAATVLEVVIDEFFEEKKRIKGDAAGGSNFSS